MSSPDPGKESFGEQLTIETPEQTSLDFPLAGIGSRFLALAHDTAIQVLCGLVLAIIAMIFLSARPFLGEAWSWTFALELLLFFFLYYGYFAFFESIWNGQTPGKRKYGIRVIHESGRPITPPQAIARNLLRIVDQFPGIYGVGIITSLISRQNKRLGDYVAGTVVVRERNMAELQPDLSLAAASTAQATYDTAKLSAEEWRLLDAFLARRTFLDAGLRFTMAAQVAKKIAQTLGVPPEERPRPEVFLEAVAQQRRRSALAR